MKRKISENKFGQVYEVDEPKNFGQLPIRHEIEVLPADPANSRKLGFKWEYAPDPEIESPISREKISSLVINQEVLVPSFIGFITMTITKLSKREATAETEKHINFLYFDKKSKTWRAEPMLVNKKALQKMKLLR